MKNLDLLARIMSPELLKLKSLLIDKSHDEFRFVGGCIRDALLGIIPHDIDICTTATPETLLALAKQTNLHVIPTGLAHGTLTFIIDHVPFEITTLRMDTETDGRHAKVSWITSFKEDAARRDFTYNAMSMDFDGNFYDYFNGVSHLLNHETVFVGDAEERIKEDYLRILRFFRFAARFDSPITPVFLSLLQSDQMRAGLASVAKERVWSEMTKLLVARARLRVANALHISGSASVIGLEHAPQASLDRADDAISALSTYSLSEDEADRLSKLWKMSTNEKRKLIWLVSNRNQTEVTFLQDALVDNVPKSWLVSHARIHDLDQSAIENFDVPNFPLTGQDLLSYGFTEGKQLGKILSEMRKKWFDSRFKLTKDALIKSLKQEDSYER